MVWGAFGLFLAVYGFFSSGESFLIPIGIIAILIGIRRTVFNFNKFGTFVNFIGLFVAVLLGALVYFFDDDGTEQQEVAKISTPRTAPIKQAPVKVAPASRMPTQEFQYRRVSTPEPNTGEPNRAHMALIPCAHPNQFDKVVFGEYGLNSIYLKFCPDFHKNQFNSIRIHYSPKISKQLIDALWIGDKNVGGHHPEFEITYDNEREYPYFRIKPKDTLFTTGEAKGLDYVVYHLMLENGKAHQLMEKAIARAPAVQPQYALEKEKSARAEKARNEIEKFAHKAVCIKQEHLNSYVIGKNGVNQLRLKLCPDFEEIRVPHVEGITVNSGVWGITEDYYQANWSSLDFIELDYQKDSVVVKPKGKKLNGYVIVELKKYFSGVENIVLNMKCAQSSDFEKVVLGKTDKDIYVKLCRGLEPIQIPTTINHRTTRSVSIFDKGHSQIMSGADVVLNKYLSNAVELSLPDFETNSPNVEYALVHLGTQ